MLRFVLLLLLVLGLLWWFGKARGRPSSVRPPEPDAQPAAGTGPQAMVRCAHCGLHLPQADAIAGDEPSGAAPAALYCSEAHRRLGPVEEPRA